MRCRGGTPWAFGLCMVAAVLMVAPAHAATTWIWQSPFTNVTTTTGYDGSGFLLDVGYDGNNAVFRITNNAGTGSITDVYWDMTVPDILDFDAYFTYPANWDANPSPPSFQPGITPVFASQAGSDSNPPPVNNGIQNGQYKEWVVRVNNQTYPNIQTALLQELSQGDLRVGIHAQAIVGPNATGSDWFVNTVVPLPAAAPLALLGMGLMGAARVIRRKKS